MATEAVLMADQKSNLIRREEVAEGTMAFHFEKPPGFTFKAWQSADVTLIDPPDTDAEGNTRTFSIVSPPFENELVFTTRTVSYTHLDVYKRQVGWDGVALVAKPVHGRFG